MDRRVFLAGSAVLLAAPLAVGAQPAQGIRRIGVVESDVKLLVEARKEGLRRLDWVEGQNIVVEHLRWGDRSATALQRLAQDIVRLKLEVVIASSNVHITAAKAATTTIPIVMVYATDPVGQGYVASLARPGGNITGLAWDPGPEIRAKLVEFVAECRSGLARLTGLVDPKYPGYRILWTHVEAAARARARGITIRAVEVREAGELAGVFDAAAKDRSQALIVGDGPFLWTQKDRIAELAARHRLPTAYPYREGPEVGGLLSYGINLPAAWHRAAVYVDKILRGAKPADLPVEQPTTFELVINLKTAKSLGLTIPPSVLARADQVIE
jgi:putative ABC transport system substrate-binding protein